MVFNNDTETEECILKEFRIMRRVLLLPVVLALVATACGGSAGADDGVASLDASAVIDAGATTAAPEPSQEEALLAFTACLRDQGIDVPDPTMDAAGNLRLARPDTAPGDPGFDRETFRAAREACAEHLQDVTLGFRGEDRTEIEDQLLEFAACVRDNGYDMPDPDFSAEPGQGGGGGPFGQIDREDPVFQAAQAACADVLPGIGRGGGLRPPDDGRSNDG